MVNNLTAHGRGYGRAPTARNVPVWAADKLQQQFLIDFGLPNSELFISNNYYIFFSLSMVSHNAYPLTKQLSNCLPTRADFYHELTFVCFYLYVCMYLFRLHNHASVHI